MRDADLLYILPFSYEEEPYQDWDFVNLRIHPHAVTLSFRVLRLRRNEERVTADQSGVAAFTGERHY